MNTINTMVYPHTTPHMGWGMQVSVLIRKSPGGIICCDTSVEVSGAGVGRYG